MWHTCDMEWQPLKTCEMEWQPLKPCYMWIKLCILTCDWNCEHWLTCDMWWHTIGTWYLTWDCTNSLLKTIYPWSLVHWRLILLIISPGQWSLTKIRYKFWHFLTKCILHSLVSHSQGDGHQRVVQTKSEARFWFWDSIWWFSCRNY